MTRLRILYSSNAFWAASGYGVQGYSLLPRLAELPEIGGRQNIAMFAWYGLHGGMHNVEGFQIYPGMGDAYGNDVIGTHTKHFGANVVISLIDVWVMHETAKRVAPALWLPWTPIDHDPVPQRILDSLQGAHLTLTYAKWGHEMLTKVGVPNHYIPHGIEPSIYRVQADADTARQFRQEKFGGASHLTVMVAANKGYPDRKAFQVQLRAWAKFAKDKPGAKLYIHTEPTPRYGGLDLFALAKDLDIAHRIYFPNQYEYGLGMSTQFMAAMYNAADAFLGASMSEGFGIPIIEAQACGVPVVVTNFSAMPELVRWGYTVEPRDMFWTPMNAWQAWPDVDGIAEALETLYAEWHDHGDRWPLAMRLAAQDAIHGEYSWDKIVREQWAPLMARLAEEAPPLEQPTQPQVATPPPAQRGKLTAITPYRSTLEQVRQDLAQEADGVAA